TFSKSLARGKYIHELQRHKIKPERVDEYVKLVSEIYPDVAQSLAPATKLCGSFMVQVGPDLDTAFHIWEYEGYSAHANRLKDSRVSEKLEKALRPLIVERESQIMLEFAFWPTSPPVDLGGVYELRSYTLRPGNLLEWEMNWRRGIECRRHLEHPIGAWFSQIGQLHQVHHLWAYPDLESRKIRREEAWKVDGWSQTVYNTVRLIDSMQNRILLPMKFSPL
ncbi:NIPSNAP-domain-containing protein, partial [Ramicandelaber brevisporus]